MWANWVVKTLSKACYVDYCAICILRSYLDGSLKHTLDFLGDVLAASFVIGETKCTALSCSCWTSSPADWSESPSLVMALGIAEHQLLILILIASERVSLTATFSLLIAG